MKKQKVKKIYRASVRVRSRLMVTRDTFCFVDRTYFRDYGFDPRGFVLGLNSWLNEITKAEPYSQFLTTPEVEEIEVDEGLCANL